MFENYLPYPDRHSKNALLLKKYQPDIDKLSAVFSEDELINLMTETDENGVTQMRVADRIIDLLPKSMVHSNQLNLLQNIFFYEKWCKLQISEFYQLAVKIYANGENKHQNKIPSSVEDELDTFIHKEIESFRQQKHKLLSPFLKVIYDMFDGAVFETNKSQYNDSKAIMDEFKWALRRSNAIVKRFLTSRDFLNRLPSINSLSPNDVSFLIFSYFCSTRFFKYLLNAINGLRNINGVIINNYLNHPETLPLIMFSILPYEAVHDKTNGGKRKNVANGKNKKRSYDITLPIWIHLFIRMSLT
ncbi:hypothetical protein KNZ39_003023 [Escherichia coli]|nr:hypothetical protein [Escherichia coli]